MHKIRSNFVIKIRNKKQKFASLKVFHSKKNPFIVCGSLPYRYNKNTNYA